jgi:ADP-heptose:LPS heptosyltransferase
VLVAHADTDPDKMWDALSFGRFFDAFLAERPGFAVALVGLRAGAPALGAPQPRKLDLTGLPLAVSLALAERADLFVGVDSCVLHAADLAGTPCVGLFGASDPVEWGLRFAPRRVLLRELPLRELAVERVLGACRDVLA